jgi:hypothetical protein
LVIGEISFIVFYSKEAIMFKYRKAMLFVNRAVYIMSAAMLVAGLALSVLPATQVVAQGSGAIWTTDGSCGTSSQDVNHFAVNDHVFINGDGFTPGSYSWAITGKPGGASSDPNIDVASGTVVVGGSGAFCFEAYTIQPGDDGEYSVKVGSKGDNYRVEGVVPDPVCEDPTATNFGGALPCVYPDPVCEDPTATNFGGALPCVYPDPVCEDPTATNFGGALPCVYPDPVCEDPNATNFGGALPCVYPDPVCEDPNATNFGGALPCTYPGLICEDPNATNTGGPLPCTYPEPTCQDPNATNFGGALPCTYPDPTCQDPSATNFGGALPCIYPLLIPETGGLLIPVTGADLTQPINGWFFGGFGMFGFGMILTGLRKMFNL